MADVISWHQGYDIIFEAEAALRVGTGEISERVRTAVEKLQKLREGQVPDWLWPVAQDLKVAGTGAHLDHRAGVEFAERLERLRADVFNELAGESEDGLFCPRCKLRLIEGILAGGKSLFGRASGGSGLTARFKAKETNEELTLFEGVDTIRAFLCPTCDGVFLYREPD